LNHYPGICVYELRYATKYQSKQLAFGPIILSEASRIRSKCASLITGPWGSERQPLLLFLLLPGNCKPWSRSVHSFIRLVHYAYAEARGTKNWAQHIKRGVSWRHHPLLGSSSKHCPFSCTRL
jgi:hypothetical protein